MIGLCKILWHRFSRSGRGPALLALVAVAHGPLAAQSVTSFDVFNLQFYTQSSVAQPNTPDSLGYVFNARIFVDAPITGAISSLASTAAPNGPYNLGTSGTLFQQLQYFSSQGALNAVYAPGAYNYSLQSNGLTVITTQTGTLTVPATPFYSLSTPYFTNFAAMQSLNAGQDFALNWNAFATNSLATLSQTFLVVHDDTQNLTVVNQFFPNAVTSSYNVVSGTLIAGDDYTATVYFSSRDSFPGAWSTGVGGLVAFDQATSASFTAIPEPAATALVAGGVCALVGFARRRRLPTS